MFIFFVYLKHNKFNIQIPWSKGLKTGLYYLRTRPVASAQKFTIEPKKKEQAGNSEKKVLACSRDNPDCEACGS